MFWKKSSLRIYKCWEQHEHESGAGAIIEIMHGKGLLQYTTEVDNDAAYLTLKLKGVPLVQLQGDEYFCPTCEKILRSAYQLEDKEDFRLQNINASKQEVPLHQAIENLTPLLTLLPSGFYVILDTQLHPTDGNAHLFWDIPNENIPSKGTCGYYLGDGTYIDSFPHFCIATQPWSCYDAQRVQYYRCHSNARAIAYHMDGFLCALLDGHHKTMAAAMDRRDVNALVILSSSFYQYKSNVTTLYVTNNLKFTAEDIGVSKATIKKQEKHKPIHQKKMKRPAC